MNVLFWMNTSFKTTSRHLLVSILKELCKTGHKVTILQKKMDDETEELPVELIGKGINCISIPIKASKKSNLIARYFKDIKYVQKCIKYLNVKYDAVFVQSTNVAGFVFYWLNKLQPNAITTINVQDIFPDNAVYSGKLSVTGLPYKLIRKMQRYAYISSNHIITISEDMKDLLLDYGVEAKKISVIYNWSYQDEVYENIDKSSIANMFSSDFFNVVYAGNIGVMQNVDILIEAAKLMKDDINVWFHIIGNGVYKDRLEARAKKYRINNISFWPMQPSELAPAIYSAADVNVIPLVKNVYKTALPSKTATCFACQKPIIFAIGKDSKFGQEVMRETGCLVVDSNNAEELTQAIRKIMNKDISCSTRAFFNKNCLQTHNSQKYAIIITSL